MIEANWFCCGRHANALNRSLPSAYRGVRSNKSLPFASTPKPVAGDHHDQSAAHVTDSRWAYDYLSGSRMCTLNELLLPVNKRSVAGFRKEAKQGNMGLYVHRNHSGVVGTGKWGCRKFGISNTCSLTLSPPEWLCIKVGSCVSHFNVSLIVWAKSQDSVRKPQFLKRKESRSGSNRGPSAYQTSALPLGHTGFRKPPVSGYVRICPRVSRRT